MYYNDDWNTLPYFLSTQKTRCDLEMLRKFDAELLIGQISYKQKADICNFTKGYDNAKKVCSFASSDKGDHKSIHGYVIKKYDLFSQTDYIFFFRIQQRQSMDRRRFEAAHLKYACLRVVSLYPKFLSLDAICFDGDTNTTVEVITPLLFCGFEAKYAGLTLHFEHFCLPAQNNLWDVTEDFRMVCVLSLITKMLTGVLFWHFLQIIAIAMAYCK